MCPSRLPTGTVRDEKRASRTFPRSTHPPASQPAKTVEQTASPESRRLAVANAEIERLRAEKRAANAEIQQLESTVKSLRSQVQRHQKAKQAIIDRYERLLSELETAAATAPTEPSAAGPRGTKPSSFVGRLTGWL